MAAITDSDTGRSADLGGGIRVTVIDAGTVRADAGTVFGPVPWVMWAPLTQGELDEEHRIPLAMSCVLIDTPSARILVDSGATEGTAERTWIEPALRAAGIEPESIDIVILTNLQSDHAGGLVRIDGRATFPDARIVAQRAEWEVARSTNPRAMTRYDHGALASVAGVIEVGLVDGDAEVAPGVQVILTGGYSLGHQVVVVRGEDATLACLGDLLVRPWAANPRWVTAFDDRPLDSVARKAALFAEAADGDWLVVASHEPTHPIGRLVRDRARFQFEAASR